jgi:hypothetical protein
MDRVSIDPSAFPLFCFLLVASAFTLAHSRRCYSAENESPDLNVNGLITGSRLAWLFSPVGRYVAILSLLAPSVVLEPFDRISYATTPLQLLRRSQPCRPVTYGNDLAVIFAEQATAYHPHGSYIHLKLN